MTNSKVAVTECASYEPGKVAAALRAAINEIGGAGAFIRAGQTVLVKPNLFSSHAPEDAVTTHPEVVRQVILLCQEAGAGRIWVGDSPVGMKSEKELWSRTSMDKAVAGTPAVLKSWQEKQMPLPCGADVLAVPEWYGEVDVLISLPKLKAHCLTTLTCALKNVYGIVSGHAKSQFHLKYPSPQTMSEFLVRVFSVIKPTMSIVDAVVAMEGNGPAHGRPVHAGFIMASADAVALDAVACDALQIEPSAVTMIQLAATAGLGKMDAADIERLGNGSEKIKAAKLKLSISRYMGAMPEWMFAGTRLLFKMRPKIRSRLCVNCGMCVSICPKKAISGQSGKNLPVIDFSNCIGCFCCLESCRESAIAAQFWLANVLCLGQQSRKARAEG